MIVHHQKLNIKKLFAGRIDLMNLLEVELAYRLKQVGKDPEQMEKVYLLDGKHNYYLGFNRKTSNDVVNQFKKAFEQIKKNGTYEKIKSKYME